MKVAVIGGGVTGLVAASELIRNGKRVIVFEAEKNLGGLAGSFRKNNWQWPLEHFFHHFFVSDKEAKRLLRRLGLINKLHYQKAKTSVYCQGSIYGFDQPMNILKFPHLKWWDKARMGFSILALRALPFLPIFERFSATHLFPSLVGTSAWQAIWEPLLEGKFGSLADEISFSWLWARVKKRSQKLGYLYGGCQLMIKALAEEIRKKNGKIATETPVLGLELREKKWLVVTKNRNYRADKIVLTVPLPIALNLIEPYLSREAKALNAWQKLKMIGALVMVLRLKRKFLPGDTYWLNILEKDFPFIVLVEHTNLINRVHYGGDFLVYVGGYYHRENPIFNWDKERVLRYFAPHLRRINPSFEKFLIDSDIFSSLFAQPIIPRNYSQIKPSLELIPGKAYWATTHHIYPWDRGLNFAIKLGRQVATLV